MIGRPRPTRRNFLLGAAAATTLAGSRAAFASFAPVIGATTLKIESVELFELHGRYTEAAGVNGQSQVNPEDIYDDLRKPEYHDKPNGTKEVNYKAIYMRIKTSGGIEGLYGPFEEAAALIVRRPHPQRRLHVANDLALRAQRLVQAGALLELVGVPDDGADELGHHPGRLDRQLVEGVRGRRDDRQCADRLATEEERRADGRLHGFR